MEQEAIDLAPLYEVLEEYKTRRGAVIPALQKAQALYGWLPKEVLQTVSKEMRVRADGLAKIMAMLWSLKGL